jgi:hypothetical protein
VDDEEDNEDEEDDEDCCRKDEEKVLGQGLTTGLGCDELKEGNGLDEWLSLPINGLDGWLIFCFFGGSCSGSSGSGDRQRAKTESSWSKSTVSEIEISVGVGALGCSSSRPVKSNSPALLLGEHEKLSTPCLRSRRTAPATRGRKAG